MRWDPWNVKNEAELQSYQYFDKLIRSLPRKRNGDFDSAQFGDNDVDAFRHAFVSGIFVHEYGITVANILGVGNELITFAYNSPNTAKSRNMDLWNNAVGRRNGCKTRKAHTLAEALVKALKAGELITSLKDKRKFDDYSSYRIEPQKSVIVLKQTRTGRNELFFDSATNVAMTRAQFVKAIHRGDYPGYRVAMYYGIATPVSRRDGKVSTNLG